MSLLLSVKVQCFLRSLVFEPWGRALETMLKGAALWTWMVRKLLKVLPSCCPQQGPFAPGPWASPALFSGFWLLRRDQLRISNHNRVSNEVKGKNEVLAHQSSKRLREWAAKDGNERRQEAHRSLHQWQVCPKGPIRDRLFPTCKLKTGCSWCCTKLAKKKSNFFTVMFPFQKGFEILNLTLKTKNCLWNLIRNRNLKDIRES